MADDHSIDREPHTQPGARRVDPSEASAERTLSGSPRDVAAREHSVFNEPAIFPNQQGVAIERDWCCSSCGYNLRGLVTGQPCPECGTVEVYHPPPEGSESFATWFVEQRDRVTVRRRVIAISLVALVGGPFAFFGAVFNSMGFIWMAAIVFGPTVEEIMKVAGIAWLVETKPYIVGSRRQLTLAAMLSALVFAAIENVIYLNLFMTSPPGMIVAWRWGVCTLLHVTCTAIAAQGIAQAWQRTADELRPPRVATALPTLMLAIVLHGTYNAIAMAVEVGGLLC